MSAPVVLAACLGLAANLASSSVLSRARVNTLNIRGARLHVLGDALGSVGVITAGLLMRFKGWTLADPLASMFIGLLIAISSWTLVKQSVNVLLEGTPTHLDAATIARAIQQIDGVQAVHDLHLWTITTGMEAMSGHIVVEELTNGPTILEALHRLLSKQFGITHTTFQLEPRQHACEPAPSLKRS